MFPLAVKENPAEKMEKKNSNFWNGKWEKKIHTAE